MEELEKVSREEKNNFRNHFNQIHQAFHTRSTKRKGNNGVITSRQATRGTYEGNKIMP